MTASMPPPAGASVSDLLADRDRACFGPRCSSACPLAMLAVLSAQSANFYWIASGHAPQLARFPDDDTYRRTELLGLIG